MLKFKLTLSATGWTLPGTCHTARLSCLASAIFGTFKHSFTEEGRELKQGQLCGVLSTWIKGTTVYVWTHL